MKTFVSEYRAANLQAQIHCRDGVYCQRCRAKSVIRHGNYRVFQQYLCKNCDRTFNDQAGTIFEHSAVALRNWFLAVYIYVRFNTSLQQIDVGTDILYKTVYRRVQRFLQRWTHLGHNLKAHSESANCTSTPDSRAASATDRRARVVSPRADVDLKRQNTHVYFG